VGLPGAALSLGSRGWTSKVSPAGTAVMCARSSQLLGAGREKCNNWEMLKPDVGFLQKTASVGEGGKGRFITQGCGGQSEGRSPSVRSEALGWVGDPGGPAPELSSVRRPGRSKGSPHL
jgi:hypothetical protein